MRELTKSMLRVSWALPLFGIRQLMNVSVPTRANQEHARRAFDAVSAAAQGEMGSALRGLHQAGDRLGRNMIEVAFGLVDVSRFMPKSGGGASAPGAGPATGAPADDRQGWGPVPPT